MKKLLLLCLICFSLDSGSENYAGNKTKMDRVSLGHSPLKTVYAPDQLTRSNLSDSYFAEYFQDSSFNSINTVSTAGQVTDFVLDTLCETLQIRVKDPLNDPLPRFNAYIVNPTDIHGDDLKDISEHIQVSMRVRSLETVNMDMLFRSGAGSMDERTDRKSVCIPGGLEEWTSFTLEFSSSDLGGFDPLDLRDFWFYLDRGSPNFAGNSFYIDYILIGVEPDSGRFSPCAIELISQTWEENWITSNPTILGGAETAKLTLTQTACEEIKIEVARPDEIPHQALRPIVINPQNSMGNDIRNISENVQVFIRARSAEQVPIGAVFRSGDGSSDFRTSILTQHVAGNLDAWSTLTYSFSEEEQRGFDPKDLIDLWIFLDRENNNFAGNEIYFDYIAIGKQPDSTSNSPCGLPNLMVHVQKADIVPFYQIYPNPTTGLLRIQIDNSFSHQFSNELIVYNPLGRILINYMLQRDAKQEELNLSSLPEGLFFLTIRNQKYQFTERIIKR